MQALAAQWLRPMRALRGKAWVRAADDEAPELRNPDSDCHRVLVLRGQLYVQRRSAFNLADCGRSNASSDWRAQVRARLLVVLRLLRVALMQPAASPWPDFTFRVCIDDDCHARGGLRFGDPPLRLDGWPLHGERPRPIFTMVACGTPGRQLTLPLVQWMATGSTPALSNHSSPAFIHWLSSGGLRDLDLAHWDATIDTLLGPARRQGLAQWRGRKQMAAWRGSAIFGHGAINVNWTSSAVLARTHVTTSNWRRSARFAVMASKCEAPLLFNVRAKVVRGATGCSTCRSHAEWTRSGLEGDGPYAACARLAGSSPSGESDKPKILSMAEQARQFQMAIHVEGSNGWADRLRHLMLSGLLVLKQDSGVKEGFEPLLLPYVHYVPVSSDLSNLSAAVRWVRAHQDEAREMARRAGEVATEALTSHALAAYAAALFRGYAEMDAARRPASQLVTMQSEAAYVRFGCAFQKDGVPCAGRRATAASPGRLQCAFSVLEARAGTGTTPPRVSHNKSDRR